jgi:hypothetical protein
MRRERPPDSFGQTIRAVLCNDVVRNNKKRQRFSGFWMPHRRGRAFVNARNGRYLRFHLANAHPKTANLDEVIRPPFNPKISLVVTTGEIASPDPAHDELAFRGFRIVKVS